ncbi:carboxylesterase family protein [Sphingomonas sp. GC_Shp_3]|uniref:carboxylesterase/lipase family protein n=1 Tax=Sphingomonas sp. GC_Shp_3 TaxID=2937383 RepID=UPI00226A5C22|nr:carboxylesterase family protein [Sphingomonas sp. GC_Shp_3]
MTVRRFLLLLGMIGTSATAAPVVKIAQGSLNGSEAAGVAVFKGIPYAAPPVGTLRWRAPAAAPTWSGVRQAAAYGPVCPQAHVTWAGHDLDRTSEDCLTLNVWTPHAEVGARLPVLVWFHGGGYTAGAGSQSTYEGSRLARRGAVIVTVNYRLGVLGYLADPALSKEAKNGTSGNYGLLDQIAALRWVQANIARFGGDPKNVTVAGQSAGGGSAMLVTIAPRAHGLFQKAIFESGAALGLPGAGETGLGPAEAAGAAFARTLKVQTLAQLRALPVATLLRAVTPRVSTGPILDGKVVPMDITAAYRSGRDAGVPILLGWNSNEAARFIDHATLAGYAASARQSYGPLAPGLLRLYPATTEAAATRAAQDLMSDAGFGWRSWSIAEARNRAGAAPVFLYQFDDPPPGPDGSRTDGAVHSDELGFVWGNDDPHERWSAADRALADDMQAYWVDFMRKGDPNGSGLPRWDAYRGRGTAVWLRRDGITVARPLRVEKLRDVDALLPR